MNNKYRFHPGFESRTRNCLLIFSRQNQTVQFILLREQCEDGIYFLSKRWNRIRQALGYIQTTQAAIAMF